jgi:hypothetical protein
MLIRILDNLVLTLLAAVQPADDFIKVSSVDAAKLNALLAVGDIAYFTAKTTTGIETVRYTHSAIIPIVPGTTTLTVDRAMLGTVRRVWPMKTCISTALTEGVLNLLICQKINGGC